MTENRPARHKTRQRCCIEASISRVDETRQNGVGIDELAMGKKSTFSWAADTRSPEQRELDRETIARLRIMGWSQSRISKEMGMAMVLVRGDCAAVERRQNRLLDKSIQHHFTTQLQRMELLLSNALEGFEQSKTAAKVVQTRLPDGSLAERLEYHPGGDPKYLTAAKSVVEGMNRLLGLDTTPVLQQTNVTIDASHLLAQPMSVEDYMQATQAQPQAPVSVPVVEVTAVGTPDPEVQRLMESMDRSDEAEAAADDADGW